MKKVYFTIFIFTILGVGLLFFTNGIKAAGPDLIPQNLTGTIDVHGLVNFSAQVKNQGDSYNLVGDSSISKFCLDTSVSSCYDNSKAD
jgi:hypothetical protein